MSAEELLWYRCEVEGCHVSFWPVRMGEPADCPGCGSILSAVYDDDLTVRASELSRCLDCKLYLLSTPSISAGAEIEARRTGGSPTELLVRYLADFHGGGHRE